MAATTKPLTAPVLLPVTTSWCTTMTSRSGSRPTTKVLGARAGRRPAASGGSRPRARRPRSGPAARGTRWAAAHRGPAAATGRAKTITVSRPPGRAAAGPGPATDPHPEPGRRLVGDQLGEQRRQSGRARPGQQFVGGDGIVQHHPERHQQHPPGQPGGRRAGRRGPPRPAVAHRAAIRPRSPPAPAAGPGREVTGRAGGDGHDRQGRVGRALGGQHAAVGDEQVRHARSCARSESTTPSAGPGPSGRRRPGARSAGW